MEAAESEFFQALKVCAKDAKAGEFVSEKLRNRCVEYLHLAMKFTLAEAPDEQVCVVAYYFIGSWFKPTVSRPGSALYGEYRRLGADVHGQLQGSLLRGLMFDSAAIRQAAANVLAILCAVDVTKRTLQVVVARLGELAARDHASSMMGVMTALGEIVTGVKQFSEAVLAKLQGLVFPFCMGVLGSGMPADMKSMAMACLEKTVRALPNIQEESLGSVVDGVVNAMSQREYLGSDEFVKNATELLVVLLRVCYGSMTPELMKRVTGALTQVMMDKNEYHFSCAIGVFAELAKFEASHCAECPVTLECAKVLDGCLLDVIVGSGGAVLLDDDIEATAAGAAFNCLVEFGVARPDKVCSDIVERYSQCVSSGDKIGVAIALARILVAIEGSRNLNMTEFWGQHMSCFTALAGHADEMIRISEFTLVLEIFENKANASYQPILAELMNDPSKFDQVLGTIGRGLDMDFKTCQVAVKLLVAICAVFDAEAPMSSLGVHFDKISGMIKAVRQKEFITEEMLLEDTYDVVGMMILHSPVSAAQHVADVTSSEIRDLTAQVLASGNNERLCTCLATLLVAFAQRFSEAKGSYLHNIMSLLTPFFQQPTCYDSILLGTSELLYGASPELTAQYVPPLMQVADNMFAAGEALKGTYLILISLFNSQGEAMKDYSVPCLEKLCRTLSSESTLPSMLEWPLRALDSILRTTGELLPPPAVEAIISVIKSITEQLNFIARTDSDSAAATAKWLLRVWTALLALLDSATISSITPKILAVPTFIYTAKLTDLDTLFAFLDLMNQLFAHDHRNFGPAISANPGSCRLLQICQSTPEIQNHPILSLVRSFTSPAP